MISFQLKRSAPQRRTFDLRPGPASLRGHAPGVDVLVTLQEWLAGIPTFALRDDRAAIYHAGIVAAIENVPLVWDAQR
jgi:hypothetical protein